MSGPEYDSALAQHLRTRDDVLGLNLFGGGEAVTTSSAKITTTWYKINRATRNIYAKSVLLPRLAPNNALQHATGIIGGTGNPINQRRDPLGGRFRLTSRLWGVNRRDLEPRLSATCAYSIKRLCFDLVDFVRS
jgi:hypothetical protein